jgi:hypothetical protein
LDGRITFQLAKALQGQSVAITVEPPSSSALDIDCRPADGPLACTPQTSPLLPHVDQFGSLQAVDMPILGTGQYRIRIAVDGSSVIDEEFQYDIPRVEGACGSSCYRSATFTIQN